MACASDELQLTTFRGDAEGGTRVHAGGPLGPRRAARRIPHGGRRARCGLPTGRVALADRLLPLGTGDGQTDVELRLTTDLGAGRWGVRAEGMYNRQLAAELPAAGGPPTQPLVGIDHIAFGPPRSGRHREHRRYGRSCGSRGPLPSRAPRCTGRAARTRSSYLSVADSIPGVPASVAAEDSKASATVLGIGDDLQQPRTLPPRRQRTAGGRQLELRADGRARSAESSSIPPRFEDAAPVLHRPVLDGGSGASAARGSPSAATPGRAAARHRPRCRRASGRSRPPGPRRESSWTSLVAMPPRASLLTTRCWSARAAICGRWVMTST